MVAKAGEEGRGAELAAARLDKSVGPCIGLTGNPA